MKMLFLYFSFIKLSLKAQLSHRKDFCMEFAVWFLYSLTPFLSLMLLLERFASIGGLTIHHIAVLYGITQCSYDFARMFGRGFDNFPRLVMNGDFDIFYIRPISIIYQVFASDVFLRRLSGIFQSLVVLTWGIMGLSIWSLRTLCCISLILLAAILMYWGLFILNGAIVLVTVKENVFAGYYIDMISQIAYYPIDKIGNPLKLVLTYILPIGCCIYYPARSLMNGDSMIIGGGLGVGAFIFFLSILVFNVCKRYYVSVNN